MSAEPPNKITWWKVRKGSSTCPITDVAKKRIHRCRAIIRKDFLDGVSVEA